MIQRNCVVFTASAFLFLIVFSIPSLIASQENSSKPSFKSSIPQSTIQNLSSTSTGDPKLDKAEFVQKTKKLQIPFIANNGQVDKQVRFYANTFGGTVFVTKDGEIVYSLPNNSPDVETQCLASSMHSPNGIRDEVGMLHDYRVSDIMHPASWIVGRDSKSAIQNLSSTSIGEPKSGVALKEEFVGARVKTIQGEQPSVTKVNYFKGNDPEKWKTDISTYDMVNLGEIYKGIELKLKAYGDNVEKLFCVKPGASPETIRVQLNGAKSLKVNEKGQLVAETELGPVKFTKPVAYQEIDGKRAEVDVEYSLLNPKSAIHNLKSNHPKSAIRNLSSTSIVDPQLEYGFKVAFYDKSHDLIIDPLLASTYLGGSSDDYGFSLALDTSGNVYVTGYTLSTNFPTTSGAYDTSLNGDNNVFISKLNSGLTSLLASTFLGGSSRDLGYSLTIDTNGNVYVVGYTWSTDFPMTSGAYDTSYNGNNNSDAFVSKLDGGLTSLLASTYLGGSSDDYGFSLALDTSGNVYVTGYTESTNFPTTSGAYDTSSILSSDAFVSKLDSGLTSLLASTALGGIGNDYGRSLSLDTSGNVYVTGGTASTNFPTTSGAYDTSFNDIYYSYSDVFVSKLDSGLTSLLASTYLGGIAYDYGLSLTLDTSGNVYVTGYTQSKDFPTTSGAYDTSYNSPLPFNTLPYDGFVSKLDGGLTSLLASTYLGGTSDDFGYSLTLDTSGNVYVTGYTGSTNFPTTSGAYNTSSNGDADVFVSKLDSDLTASTTSTPIPTPPPVSSPSPLPTLPPLPSPIPSPSLSKECIVSGYVTNQNDNILEDVTITITGIDFSDKTSSDKEGYYLFRSLIAGEYTLTYEKEGYVTKTLEINLIEGEFKYLSYTVLIKQMQNGRISGYVYNMRDYPIESAKIRLKRANSRVLKKTFSDEDGFFEFTDLDADTYIITALKSGYKMVKQTITLEEGEEKDIEIVIKKTIRRNARRFKH